MLLTPTTLHGETKQATPKRYSVLVLCTGNSARSIMAEALFNSIGKPWFSAFSAGSRPIGRVNPFALEQIEHLDAPIAHYRSKNWHEFSQDDAPIIDFVITVCDSAATEVCPVFHGEAVRVHWGLPDPASVQESTSAAREAFAQVFSVLRKRIEVLTSMPLDRLDKRQVADVMKQLIMANPPALEEIKQGVYK